MSSCDVDEREPKRRKVDVDLKKMNKLNEFRQLNELIVRDSDITRTGICLRFVKSLLLKKRAENSLKTPQRPKRFRRSNRKLVGIHFTGKEIEDSWKHFMYGKCMFTDWFKARRILLDLQFIECRRSDGVKYIVSRSILPASFTPAATLGSCSCANVSTAQATAQPTTQPAAQPAESTAQAAEATTQPAEATAQPAEATTQPAEATARMQAMTLSSTTRTPLTLHHYYTFISAIVNSRTHLTKQIVITQTALRFWLNKFFWDNNIQQPSSKTLKATLCILDGVATKVHTVGTPLPQLEINDISQIKKDMRPAHPVTKRVRKSRAKSSTLHHQTASSAAFLVYELNCDEIKSSLLDLKQYNQSPPLFGTCDGTNFDWSVA